MHEDDLDGAGRGGGDLSLSRALASDALDGTKDVVLQTRDGQALTIGTIVLTSKNGRTSFDPHLDRAKFKPFFLSMKEFKCVEGQEIVCHVPYPYAHPDTVTATDLWWLEHRLLFFYKQPADYGAQLTNGIVYAMKVTDGGIVGTPQGIDLDAMAVPPANPMLAPMSPASATRSNPARAGARALPSRTTADAPRTQCACREARAARSKIAT